MMTINSKYEKTLNYMIYGSLMALAFGLLSSISILAFAHILLIFPIFYFLSKTNFKEFKISTWALVAFFLAVIVSILVNQDIAVNGLKPLSKSKYFLFGFLSIVPYTYYFSRPREKEVKSLLYVFLIVTTAATIFGVIGMISGMNPLTHRVTSDRNSGFFGMIMNYAHNLAFFQIIVLGLILYRKEVEKIINVKFLWFVAIINFYGLYTSYTRGAWVALLAAIPFYVFKNNKKKFLIVVIASLVAGGIIYKLSGDLFIRPGSDSKRLNQWRAATVAYVERPILGYGYLNFEPLSTKIKEKYGIADTAYRGHAHNNFFEVLGTTGTIGFLAFMLWLVMWFVEMLKRDDLIARLAIPFIVVFIAGGLSQSTITLGINLFFVMAVYAITQIDLKLLKD